MTTDKFKTDVQSAYKKAVENKNSWKSYADGTHRLFEGVALYGRDAAFDFVESQIDFIFEQAIEAAEAKRDHISFRPRRIGKAAMDGTVEALRTLTGLEVTQDNSAITLTWAKPELGLI